MAKVEKELAGIGQGWSAAGDSIKSRVASVFDPVERAARKAERTATADALKAAKPEIEAATKEAATARAAAAAAKTKEAIAATVERIKSGPVEKTVETAAKKGSKLFAIPRASAKAGIWVVEQPIALALKPVKWASNGVASAVAKRPVTALIVGGVTAVVAGANLLAKGRGKQLEAQNDAVQQLQAVQAAQPVSYMNSASYSDVQAKIDADRANGAAPGSATAAVASRAAAAPTPAV